MLYSKCKEFINEFQYPLNYDELQQKLNEISEINCNENNCDSAVAIHFQEMPEFGVGARVKDGDIRFNKMRIETLLNLDIDCLNKNHLNWMWNFYNSYDTNKQNSKYEESLYAFMKKYIEMGAQRYFADCGSYKLIPYDLLECVFHENQHVFQKKYDKYLSGELEYPTDTKSAMLIFTEAFNIIYNKLKKNNVDFKYERNNYIFPIEFDARYEAMIKMNELKQQYFKNDEMFAKYLVSSNIIPENLDVETTSEEIFETYIYFYNIYKSELVNDFDLVSGYLSENKDKIVNEIKRRYREIISIVGENKLGDNACEKE